MADKWTVAVSRPGATDETSFDTEKEAVAYAEDLDRDENNAIVILTGPDGIRRVMRSGSLSASA